MIAVAAVAYAAFFYRDILASRVYVFRDIYTILFATEHVVRLLADWEWPPLWNPFQVLGKPLVAEPLAGIYYPFNWILRLLPEPLGYNVSVVWHHLWTAAGTYLLARRRAASPTGAALAALLCAFGGLYVSFDNMLNALQAAAWVPWALLAFDVWLERRDATGCALLALSLAMTLLGGMPEAFLMENALMAAMVVERRRAGGGPTNREIATTWVIANGLALGLGAVQLLPFAEYLAHSSRAGGLRAESVMRFSLEPLGIFAFLVPRRYRDAAGGFHDSAALWEAALAHAPWAVSLYVGPLLLLALAAGARLSRSQRALWAAVAALFVVLALGENVPGLGLVVGQTPLFRFARYPEKLLIVPHLLLAVAAGLGLDAVIGMTSRARGVAVAAVAVAGICVAAALTMRGAEALPLAVLHDDLYLLAPLLLALALLCAVAHRAPQMAALGILALAAADLYRVNALFLPTVAWTDVMRVPRAVGMMKRGDDPLRVYSDGAGLPHVPVHPHAFLQEQNLLLMEVANYYGIANLNAPASLNLADHELLERMIERAPRERVGAFLAAFNTAYVTSPKRLERPGLTQVAAARGPTEAFVYRVENVKPRAFVAPRLHAVKTRDEAIAHLADAADPAEEVVVSADGIPSGLPEEMAGTVRLESYHGRHVDLAASLQTPGLVVLTDTFYPGWHATVDGKPAPIVRANLFARGVFVDAGEHRISFSYDPASHRIGLLCSLACGLIVLGGIAASELRRR